MAFPARIHDSFMTTSRAADRRLPAGAAWVMM
jgi:hypothetical protein